MNNLEKILKQEKLMLPCYNNKNIVDLIRCVYNKVGCNYNKNYNIEYLDKIIPNNNHLLFILSDGTGSNLIDKLEKDSILKINKKMDLLTVFPSTTGCVLTSIVTATYPEEHGIWGWFNYNKKLNIDYYPVLFLDRKNKKSLLDYNINTNDIFKSSSVLKKLDTKVNVLFPTTINNSVYSKFVIDDDNRHPYSNFSDIVEFMENNCLKNTKSYTYLYIPDVDSIEHENGVDSKKTLTKLKEIDNLVKELSKNKNLTIVFTADHGQTNINKDIILDFEKYSKYFYAYPSIDCGTASYYIKKEYYDDFVNEFNKDFKDEMFLFKKDEFIDKKMFGIGNISKYARDNLGEFISICKKGSYLINSPNTSEYFGKIKGCHSGLSHDEMIIPLIIIDTNKL